jgi:hypothetical protein
MKTHFRYGKNSLSITLSFLVIFQMVVSPAHSQTLPTELNLVVVEGEGAINNVRQRVAREPIVRVEDENHKPVAGAAVVFTLPTEGATGEFAGGAKTITVMTDAEGQARARGFKVNRTNGKLPIHVSASYRGLATRTVITQINEGGVAAATSSSGGHGHGVLIGVLVAVGAAAAGGGAYLATRQNKQSSTTAPPPAGSTPIGITPGTGSIAGGR